MEQRKTTFAYLNNNLLPLFWVHQNNSFMYGSHIVMEIGYCKKTCAQNLNARFLLEPTLRKIVYCCLKLECIFTSAWPCNNKSMRRIALSFKYYEIKLMVVWHLVLALRLCTYKKQTEYHLELFLRITLQNKFRNTHLAHTHTHTHTHIYTVYIT